MMNLDLNESLPALVTRSFTKARDTGSLTFSATQLANIHLSSGLPVLD